MLGTHSGRMCFNGRDIDLSHVVEGRVFVAKREAGHVGQTGPSSPRPSAPAREHTSWMHASNGVAVGESALKEASYLGADWGTARKAQFFQADAAVGFAQAPAAAKMHAVQSLVGEAHVSRTFRYQGSRPVVVNGVMFDTTGDRLEATDLAENRLLWSWDNAKSEEGERRLTPPAVSNDRVLVGTWDGRVISFDAATGDSRWEVQVGAPCHWQPVMSGGRVFAGLEDGSVVAFDTGDPADDGWPMWGCGPGHNGSASTRLV